MTQRQKSDQQLIAEITGTLGFRRKRKIGRTATPKRRAVGRSEVRAIGGPLNGMTLVVETMSDGMHKIVGGSIYESIYEYDLHVAARELRWKDAS